MPIAGPQTALKRFLNYLHKTNSAAAAKASHMQI